MRIPQELMSVLQLQRDVVTSSYADDKLGSAAVRWRVARGQWQRPRPGVLVTHSGPLDEQQRLWVDLLSVGRGALLAGLTAAELDGLRGFQSTVAQILVPHRRRPGNRPGLVVRRSRQLSAEDVHPARLPPRTRLPRSLVDAAAWAATEDRARAVLAAGIQQRLARPGDKRVVLNALTKVHRRSLILRTLDDIEGGAQAVSELDFARLLRRFRLPEATRQVMRRDDQGRSRWLDAFFEEWQLVVEIDGCWHMEATQWWSDMLRDNEMTVDGYRVLRFPAFIVREQPQLVARQVAAALCAAGWQGDAAA